MCLLSSRPIHELASGSPQFAKVQQVTLICFNEPLKANFYLYFTQAALACPCFPVRTAQLKCVPIQTHLFSLRLLWPSTGAACALHHNSHLKRLKCLCVSCTIQLQVGYVLNNHPDTKVITLKLLNIYMFNLYNPQFTLGSLTQQ